MVSGGSCLARVNGKSVFIPHAIPGEKVAVEIRKSFRDYDIASLREVLEPSPHRRKPFCPLYGTCGGCNMQHIDAAHQVSLRAAILEDTFARAGVRAPEVEVVSGSGTGYRARIQLTDGGFCGRGANVVVRLDRCPVATEEINGYLGRVPQDERPRGRAHIFGDRRVLGGRRVIVAEGPEAARTGGRGGTNSEKPGKSARFSGSVPDERNACAVELSGKRIEFDARGFFQSNLAMLEAAIGKITGGLGGRSALDLYAGCGTFSVFLADLFEKTTLVEHNRDALVFAERNLLGKKHESYGQSGRKWVLENARRAISGGAFDAVVVDPPRSGMEKEVRAWLCGNKAAHVRSVSCDPGTHARDAALLVRVGYRLTKLFLLDFYPQTSHIESLAFFDYGE